jgi:transcriptional regulator with XRE-family HTH domain
VFEWLFSKKNGGNRSTGTKIREIRLRKGISSSDLGAKCHITDAAVRHYEGDKRTPNEEKLQEIAAALGVDVTALYDRKIESIADIMHILFEAETAGYIVPVEIQADITRDLRQSIGIRSTNEVLSEAMQKWLEKWKLWKTEQISEDDYRNWQDAFPQEYEVEVHPEHETYPSKSVISDYRIHSLDFLRKFRTVMEYDTERVDAAIRKENARYIDEFYSVLRMNLFSWIDHEIEQLEQEPLIQKGSSEDGSNNQ